MKRTTLILLTFCITLGWGAHADITFFVASDSHYGLKQWESNEKPNKKAIHDMNSLPGVAYPLFGAGVVSTPKGVVVTGDLTDSGTLLNWYGWWLLWSWSRDGFVSD